MGELLLVTGGARSGKSRFAERLAAETARPVVYLATMEPIDEEMHERIIRHRATRPDHWRTIEAPIQLTAALRDVSPESCILIDCVSVWASNQLLQLDMTPSTEDLQRLESRLDREIDEVCAIAGARTAPTIVVTNEVGSGLVPEYPLGRAYRDLLGRVNQRLSMAADRAWLLVSGRALLLPPPARE